MKMKKLTSLCGCLLLSMCMGVGAMTAPLSAEAAARERVLPSLSAIPGLKLVQLPLSVSWRASAAPISLYIWALMKPFARTVSLT